MWVLKEPLKIIWLIILNTPATTKITIQIWGMPGAWYFWSRSCTICINGKDPHDTYENLKCKSYKTKKDKLLTRKPLKLDGALTYFHDDGVFLKYLYRYIELAREAAK